MARKYTPEQEIINLRSKGKITHSEARRRIAALGDQKDAGLRENRTVAREQRKRDKRPLLRKILDFFSRS